MHKYHVVFSGLDKISHNVQLGDLTSTLDHRLGNKDIDNIKEWLKNNQQVINPVITFIFELNPDN